MPNNNFCVLPFYSFENKTPGDCSTNIYCCRLSQPNNIQQVRQDMVAGVRSQSCSTCWKLEDNGQISERILHNRALDFYWDRDIERIERDALDGDHTTRMVKLLTSNICNGTCVTCGPALSTAWAKLNGQTVRYDSISMGDLSGVDLRSIKSLSFVGGEPLLEKNNFEILQHLADIGNQSCFVSIVTNGSMDLSDRQLDVLNQFDSLNLCLSIDGIGRKFEYLRYPLRWSKLLHNLDSLRKITKNISVSCMISNINIGCYDEIIDWFETQDLPFLCKQIEYPGYFSPGNLPDDMKERILGSSQRSNEVAEFLSIGAHSHGSWTLFRNEIQRQDRLKQISIKDYLPDMDITKIF